MTLITSIKNKILIFAILATIIPSTGLGLLFFWKNEQMVADNVTHQLRTLALDASRELEFWLEERTAEVRTLSTSNTVINGLSAQSPPSLPRYLQLVQEKLNSLLQLSIYNANGKLIASSGPSPAPILLPNPWPQSALTHGVIIKAPHRNQTHDATTLTLAVPVLSMENEILGALVAVIDLNTVLPSLKYSAQLSPGAILLLDLDGNPLLATHRGKDTSFVPIARQVLQRLRADNSMPITFEGHLQKTVLGLAIVPNKLPLMVLVERDRDEIYEAWLVSRNLFLGLMTLLTLIVSAFAWRLGRSIVTPLERLTTAADHIATGDLTIRLPVARRDELGHLTEVFNQMTEKLQRSHKEFESASLTLKKQNKLLETLSVTDSLTGLYNRKKLDDILDDQLERFKRNQRPFAVLMLDIDHFKALNDTYGHLAGDQVLESIARTFNRSIRNIDFAARYGGEEFAIVLPETGLSAARDMAERILTQVRGAAYQFNDQSIAVTLSIGVTISRNDDKTPEAVLSRADKMLYKAKSAGRNQVTCSD